MTTLTPAQIAQAIRYAYDHHHGVQLADPTMRNLNLRISASGKVATWTWLGSVNNRVRRFSLGYWPHIGIAQARRLAHEMTYKIRFHGFDPVAEKRAEQERRPSITFDQFLDRYGATKTNVSSWPKMRKQIENIFVAHRKTPIDRLAVERLQATIDEHPKQSSASFGVACLLPVLRWGAEPSRKLIDPSLLAIKKVGSAPERDRVLSMMERTAVLSTLRKSDSPHGKAFRLILLTAARIGEVQDARWRDVDFNAGTWLLPNTKNRKAHTIPLSRQARALLTELRPAAADPADFVFAVAGGRLTNFSIATATEHLHKVSGTSGWHRHDLRRTAATTMGEIGIHREIIEAVLNHTPPKLSAIYVKASYLPQVADALQRLADRLDDIEAGRSNVIPFSASQEPA